MGKFQRIIGQDKIGPYVVLYLDKSDNNVCRYNRYKINNKIYKPVVMYDTKDSVAFISENDTENFVGELLEYIEIEEFDD